MIIEGNDFVYFVNGESKTKEEVNEFIDSTMSVTIDNLTVHFISPKKDKQANLNVVSYYKQREKESLESTKNYLLNNTSVLKDYEDIVSIFFAENEEELSASLNKIKLKNGEKVEKQSTYGKLEDTPISAKKDKIKELLEEVNKHQEQNGRVVGVEFPFDAVLTPTREQKVIEDWNKIDLIGLIEGDEKGSFGFNFQKSKIGEKENKTEGIKETENKVDYSEINFKLLDLMAKRFNDNKHKYPKGNTLKVINKDEILWAAFRHIRKMIQPIENDPETYEDHLAAVATNMSIILDQIYRK